MFMAELRLVFYENENRLRFVVASKVLVTNNSDDTTGM